MSALDKRILPRAGEIEQLTLRAVADMIGVSPRTVYDALMNWPIPVPAAKPRRHQPQRSFAFEEATVRSLYFDKGYTVKEIAEHLSTGRSSVLAAMNYWQIPRRRRGRRPSKSPSDPL